MSLSKYPASADLAFSHCVRRSNVAAYLNLSTEVVHLASSAPGNVVLITEITPSDEGVAPSDVLTQLEQLVHSGNAAISDAFGADVVKVDGLVKMMQVKHAAFAATCLSFRSTLKQRTPSVYLAGSSSTINAASAQDATISISLLR